MAELLCHLGILNDYDWINVGDRLYFWGYGIPCTYVKRILFSSEGNVS